MKRFTRSVVLVVSLVSVGLPAWAPLWANEAPGPVPTLATEKSEKAEAKARKDAEYRGPQLPKLLREVEAKYVAAKTLSAKFSQVNESAALKTKKATSGQIFVKHPDKVRWETHSPDKNLLVSDGRKFWFYTPPFDEGENGQVIERRSNDVKSKLAQALLSGSFSKVKDLQVERVKDNEYLLKPKRGTAGTVKQAKIEIDLAEKTIHKVTIEHQDGNRSEISLSGIKLGDELSDALFVFEAPPGTDKVTQ